MEIDNVRWRPDMNGLVERYHSAGLTSRRRSGRRCESESWWRKGVMVEEIEAASSNVEGAGSDILRCCRTEEV